jgi:hypothetical protein
MAAGPLACPSCAAAHPADERFCRSCGMPLVHPGGPLRPTELSERQTRARKIKPQYTEGELVCVAAARNLPEAEFIQGMLLEEGVPSLLRRGGFGLPGILDAGGGPRDVLVAASGALTAREVLGAGAIVADASAAPNVRAAGVRVMAALLLIVAIVFFGGYISIYGWR